MKSMKKTYMAAIVAALAVVSAPALAGYDWTDSLKDKMHQQEGEPQITRERAIAIAQERYPNVPVVDVELKHRTIGKDYYEIDLEDNRSDYSVRIDSDTGKIIRAMKKFDD